MHNEIIQLQFFTIDNILLLCYRQFLQELCPLCKCSFAGLYTRSQLNRSMACSLPFGASQTD